jgi:hypothetical protein
LEAYAENGTVNSDLQFSLNFLDFETRDELQKALTALRAGGSIGYFLRNRTAFGFSKIENSCNTRYQVDPVANWPKKQQM